MIEIKQFICTKWIWHNITYNGWYAAKPNQTKQRATQDDLTRTCCWRHHADNMVFFVNSGESEIFPRNITRTYVSVKIFKIFFLFMSLLLWIPTHGRAKAGRPARTYIQQLCEDTGCCPEDLPRAMNDREEWRERVRDIRAASTV